MLKRYKNWQLHRQQLSLARWPENRVKGKERFVLYETFSLAVFMTAAGDVASQLFDSHEFSLWFYLVVNLVTGYFIGCRLWEDREGEYQNAQQLKSSPQVAQLQPH